MVEFVRSTISKLLRVPPQAKVIVWELLSLLFTCAYAQSSCHMETCMVLSSVSSGLNIIYTQCMQYLRQCWQRTCYFMAQFPSLDWPRSPEPNLVQVA